MAVDWEKVEFKDEKRFLSNMYVCNIIYKGKKYGSSEHIYQAMKSENIEYQEYIRGLEEPTMTKKEADRLLGDIYEFREDWESVKLALMEEILYLKFEQNLELKEKIIKIDGYIEEKNSWGDRFWGTSEGEGENHLGRLLMKVREEM